MAQRTVVELIDDIDGKLADETVSFSIDGVTYEIDLSKANASKLRTSVSQYVEKARKAGAKPGRKAAATRTVNSRERSSDIRTWAKQHGITVNDRGRIPAQVIAAYEANDPGKAKEPAPRIPQTTFKAVSNP
jgi:nucleoid-associated protein Lsr2